MLAKEIIEAVLDVAGEKKLSKIESVALEIGSVSLAHDGFPEHADEISLENLNFGLESLAKGTILERAKWEIQKVAGNSWKIKEISGQECG